jgi:hypothetical protein
LKKSREDAVEQIGELMLHGGGLERRRSSRAEIPHWLTIVVAVIGRIAGRTYVRRLILVIPPHIIGRRREDTGEEAGKEYVNSCWG